MPFTMAMFLFGAAAISGIPPFNGFASKWMIYESGFNGNLGIASIIAVVVSALTLASFIKVGHSVFFGPIKKEDDNVEDVPLSMKIPMGILAALTVVLGIMPRLVVDNLLIPVVRAIYNLPIYIGSALGNVYGVLDINFDVSKIEFSTNGVYSPTNFLILFIILLLGVLLFVIFIFLFFKTSLFQKYKELWVETAMSTMNHQFLATWFLSEDEINKILKKSEVQNNENSNSDNVTISNEKEKNKKEISLEKITGKNCVGFVMTIPDASKVKLVDGRKSSRGSKLSEIVTSNNAIAGINAGGFSDDGGVGAGNLLNTATIMNKTLQYGNKTSRYSFIGLSSDSKLVLGKYTYQEALNHKIESAIEFGPYLIVNGKNQISNSNSGRNPT